MIALLALTLTTAFAQDAIPAREIVGLTVEDASQKWSTATVTYEMSHRVGTDVLGQPIHYSDAVLSTAEHTWPVHAMKWKDYASGQTHGVSLTNAESHAYATDLSIYWSNGTFCNQQEVELNAMEAGAGSVFSSDPSGTWMCSVQGNPLQGAIFAALVMHYWGSPVYVSFNYDYLNTGFQGTYSVTAGLRQLTFLVVGTGVNDLHDACGLNPTDPPATALASVSSCGGVTLTQSETALFNADFCPTCPGNNYLPYEEARTFSGADTLAYYALSLGTVGHLVFDPPAHATEDDIVALVEMSTVLSEQLLLEDEAGVLQYASDLVEIPEQ